MTNITGTSTTGLKELLTIFAAAAVPFVVSDNPYVIAGTLATSAIMIVEPIRAIRNIKEIIKDSLRSKPSMTPLYTSTPLYKSIEHLNPYRSFNEIVTTVDDEVCGYAMVEQGWSGKRRLVFNEKAVERRSPQVLEFITAHEIAHVENGDTERFMSLHQRFANSCTLMAGIILGNKLFLAANLIDNHNLVTTHRPSLIVASVLCGLSLSLRASIIRDAEYLADAGGARKIGHIKGAREFFEDMKKWNKPTFGRFNPLNTHPEDDKRVEALEKLQRYELAPEKIP